MKTRQIETIERGILTSSYKNEIRQSIVNSKRETLSNIKLMIENHQAHVQSKAGTVLQVALFAFALVLIIA